MDNNPYNPQQPQPPIEPQAVQPQQPAQYPYDPQQNGAAYSSQPAQSSSGIQELLKNKKVLVAVGAALTLLTIMLIVVLAFGGSEKPAIAPADSPQTRQDTLLSPATAIDIEQISNSISQDVSTMNDDSQLPVTRIDDKTLGL